jgi:hypothetical protein
MFLAALCLVGCKPDASEKTADKKVASVDGVTEAAGDATSCDDLQKIYDDHKAEIEAMGKDVKPGDDPQLVTLAQSCADHTIGVTDPKAQDNTPTSCGCLLSGWDCTLMFFGCTGGDAPSCCWFSEACIHDTVMSDCMNACNNCSQWGHIPPPAEG